MTVQDVHDDLIGLSAGIAGVLSVFLIVTLSRRESGVLVSRAGPEAGESGHRAGTSLAPPGPAAEPVAQEFLYGTFLPGAAIEEGQVLSPDEPADECVAPVGRAPIGPEVSRVNDHAIPAAGAEAQR